MAEPIEFAVKAKEPVSKEGKTLHELIGSKPFLHHIAIPAQPGRLDAAVYFFTRQLGWIELKERTVKGEWGEARFVQHSSGGIIVQITQHKDKKDDLLLPIAHLAIAVERPSQLVQEMRKWAAYAKTPISAENRGNGKWFVSLKGILGVHLELVPLEKD